MTTVWKKDGSDLTDDELSRIGDLLFLRTANFALVEDRCEPHTPDECTLHRGGLLFCGRCERIKSRKTT